MTEPLDYGNPGEELAQEFAMFLKGSLRNVIHGAANMERTVPELIADIIMTILKLPFAIIYAMMTYNENIASLFQFIYMMVNWYILVACIFFIYLSIENIYKAFYTSRLAMLGRLKPWYIISSILGVRDTDQNDLDTTIMARNNNFSVNVVKIPMTGLILQVLIAFLMDIVVSVMVSLAWPITTSVFIITTIITCRAPKVFYEYTIVETNITQRGNIQKELKLSKNIISDDRDTFQINKEDFQQEYTNEMSDVSDYEDQKEEEEEEHGEDEEKKVKEEEEISETLLSSEYPSESH